MSEGFKNCYEYFYLTWTPVVEDENLENAFITGYSHENIKSGRINKVPLLIGFNSQEILLFSKYFIYLHIALSIILRTSLVFTYSQSIYTLPIRKTGFVLFGVKDCY